VRGAQNDRESDDTLYMKLFGSVTSKSTS